MHTLKPIVLHTVGLLFNMRCRKRIHLRFPVDSILDAVFTVSPNTQ